MRTKSGRTPSPGNTGRRGLAATTSRAFGRRRAWTLTRGPTLTPRRLSSWITGGGRACRSMCGPVSAFRPGGGFSGATGQHGVEFGNLGVDVPLLFLESKDGGGDDFGCESCWHVSLSHHPG